MLTGANQVSPCRCEYLQAYKTGMTKTGLWVVIAGRS